MAREDAAPIVDDDFIRHNDGPWTGPIPVASIDSQAYWAGLREGELRILRCSDCGNWIHYPLARCQACHSTAVLPTPASGRGTVYTFTVAHREFSAGIAPPYIVAVVELEEQAGLRMLTNLVNCRLGDARIGMPVRAVFRTVTEEAGLVFFEPAPDEVEA